MSQKIADLKLGLSDSLEEKLELLVPNYSSYKIIKESIDARRRHDLRRVLTLEVFEQGETPPIKDLTPSKIKYSGRPVVIIGAGPAGLFAAIRLVERGIPIILLERGSNSVDRLKAINRFWRYGELNPDDNVCYGEGGAGMYSDGKLMTRIKSEYIGYILRRFVDFGAPPEIEYLANPHVGSDRIRRLIPKMRQHILDRGGVIHFNTKVSHFEISSPSGSSLKPKITAVVCSNGQRFESDHFILATGHSATDMYYHLHEMGVSLEGKSFAMGVRIEHPQKLINSIQYRQYADHPKLGAANYKLTHFEKKTGIGVYSFCMCPGGYILSSGTDADGVVCNGMSNYNRNSPFANSGIVVTIDFNKQFKNDLFGGLKLQRSIERKLKKAVEEKGGNKQIPAQRALDFLEGKLTDVGPSSTPSGVIPVRIDEHLPKFLLDNLKQGLIDFENKMSGFLGPNSQIHAIESRTSSPLRILRDPKTLESTSHQGLYPVGEGAGYAGGITSAAVDGIKAAEALVGLYSSVSQEKSS